MTVDEESIRKLYEYFLSERNNQIEENKKIYECINQLDDLISGLTRQNRIGLASTAKRVDDIEDTLDALAAAMGNSVFDLYKKINILKREIKEHEKKIINQS